MKHLKKSIQFLSIGIVTILLTQCATQQQAADTSQTAQVESQAAESGVTSFTVDGLQVLVKQTPGNPVVAAGFFLNGGTKYVPKSQAGIERFALRAATEGTKNYPRDVLNARLESMGTTISAGANYDYNGLQLNTLQRNFDESWKLFQDVIVNPVYETEDVDIVRQQLLTGLRSIQDDPDSYVAQVANNLFYANTPYAVSLYGNEEVLQSATPEDLKAYHSKHLTKDRALLVVVGDVTPDMISKRASELAAALPAGSADEAPNFGSFAPGDSDMEIAERELPTNYIRGQFKAPSLADPDYPAFSAAMRILRNKLFEEVRTKRNLSYAPAAGVSQRVQNYGLIYVSTAFPDTTIKVMFATIDEMIDSPLPAQTVKNEISQSITRNLMQQETAEAQMGQLANYQLVAGDYRLADDYLTELERLQPEDIQSAMKKYVKDIHFGIVGDPSKIDTELFTQK
ncbi:MAG: hypothetical protein GF372_01545 [Candidatus Marinimicrobia bacterium]|nr:hypothetical protein [Candidatus Neomarinimicrobiota bacterium]